MDTELFGSTEKELIEPSYDKFLDGNPTRRELEKAFRKIGLNMTEFWRAVDTSNLVLNYLCEEKLNISRGELDAYVQKKAAETQAYREKLAAGEPQNESKP